MKNILEPDVHFKAGFAIKIIMLSLAAIGFAQPIYAQHRQVKVHQATATRNIARVQTRLMNDRMQLKGSQKPRVEAINTRYAEKLSTLLTDKQLSREQKLQELQKLHADKKADLQTILSPDQYQEYLKLQQDLKEQRNQRMSTEAVEEPVNQ